jgi:hypothetical protein
MIPETRVRELRQFGLLVGGVFGVIGAWPWLPTAPSRAGGP